MTQGHLGGYASGPGFVVGRSEGPGDFRDVRIRTTAEGLNVIELARDARDTSPRRYVVDRLLLPNGAWSRVVEVDSFSPGSPPERMTESHASVRFVGESNHWGIEPEPCFGLPVGMESPWTSALEMTGNELLVPLLEDSLSSNGQTVFVSGDAPVNIAAVDNAGVSLRNGSYEASVNLEGIEITPAIPPRADPSLYSESVHLLSPVENAFANAGAIEGTAGIAYFDGGSIFLEPAKPPILFGSYVLPFDVRYVADGLYEALQRPGVYVITSQPIEGRHATGLVSVIFDPYPLRWVPRLMGRAYCELTAPAYVPPLIEEEPERISVATVEVENDFPDIPREVYTPYADRTGVFNSWEAERTPVVYRPSIRPFDVLIPFDPDTRHRDLGGHPAFRGEPNGLSYTRDSIGELAAARPPIGGMLVGFESAERLSELDLREGTLFYRWRDSEEFNLLRSPDLEVYYKQGYIYVYSKTDSTVSGLARIDVRHDGSYTATKLDWGRGRLLVNETPALTEMKTWADTLFVGETTETRSWAEVMGVTAPGDGAYKGRNPALPRSVEQFADVPPVWETGRPLQEGESIAASYGEAAVTWGRVLFEDLGEPTWLSPLTWSQIGDPTWKELGVGVNAATTMEQGERSEP